MLCDTAPPIIICYFENVEQMVQGGKMVTMSHRKIEGSFNYSQLSGANNIQGDYVNQDVSNQDSVKLAFQELFNEIDKLNDSQKKDQARFFAEQLEQALKNDEKDKGKKLIGFLKDSLGVVSSLVTIAKFFGISI